jgi:sigma-E factor negative regulatory protein RseC
VIEETVHVTTTEGELAWVESAQRKTSCGHCVARSSCGTSVLSKVLGRRAPTLVAHNPIGAKPGDRVVIGLHNAALVRGSVAVYLVPLLTMLAGALVGEALLAGAGDGPVVLLGLTGLAIGFAWVRRFARRAASDPRYRPVILRMAPEEFAPVHFKN